MTNTKILLPEEYLTNEIKEGVSSLKSALRFAVDFSDGCDGHSICNSLFYCPLEICSDSKYVKSQIKLEHQWLYVLHMLYRKKYDDKHTLPSHRDNPRLQTRKKWLEILHALLEVSIQVHTYGNSKCCKSATEWFASVAYELKQNVNNKIIEGKTPAQVKQAILTNNRELLTALKAGINIIDSQKNPYTWNLVNGGLTISASKYLPDFRKKYWRPLLVALDNVLTGDYHLDDDWHIGCTSIRSKDIPPQIIWTLKND